MSLKQEIETWVAALARYDNNEFDEALKEFESVSDTSKILFNMGVIHATLGEHEKAVECYQRAIRLDQYLAVAYFQQGVSNFLLGDFEEALANFNDTLLYLRGNTMIDYAQLGLLFKLYSCEVLFNRGLCYIYLQQKDAGLQDLQFAVKEKVVEDHNVIDEAIREEAEGYTVFSIPVGVVYRPNDAKVRNLKTKDYLGKARLVAASDRANAFTGFAGSEIKNAGQQSAKDDRPTDNISFAATNLVKPGLQSRASVRNGPKPTLSKLNIERAVNNRYEKTSSPQSGPRRQNTTRSNSSTPQRSYSQRQRNDEEEDYADDVYDMYQGGNNGGGGGSSRGSRQQGRRNMPRYIEEEEDEGSEFDDGSFDEGEFEMVSNRRANTGSMSAGSSRGQSRRPEVRKVRVKVHAEDVRYIMIGSAIEFPDFVDRVRDKFGLRRRFKIKVRDDDMPNGDMITLGDQDDLDMVLMTVKSNARRQRQEIGKMEVWVQEV
ncbi:unnamed protein product [Parascedosporium putredinis]|uniref:PB1 domain-containing protein n=1 Tax=Parascedosporium putredinis TaxID=1442378 RepID=A0A9P1MF78_9PEZI|nr:unnamed protein product [Parascedosporium putredinis]CAI8002940.1 unnamed protein product [Parascedosporium putredinis]